MKAILSILTIVVAAFFGYNHAASIIASRPPVVEAPPQTPSVAPVPVTGEPRAATTTPSTPSTPSTPAAPATSEPSSKSPDISDDHTAGDA